MYCLIGVRHEFVKRSWQILLMLERSFETLLPIGVYYRSISEYGSTIRMGMVSSIMEATIEISFMIAV